MNNICLKLGKSSNSVKLKPLNLPLMNLRDLKDEEQAALLKVLKSHKRAIAWKLSDIKGVSPEFCNPDGRSYWIKTSQDSKPHAHT
ncbi:hypothetical protein Tco_0826297 [Tanacetum coccineum]